jgi:hypothetical protein
VHFSSLKEPGFTPPLSSIVGLPRMHMPCHRAGATSLQASSTLSDKHGDIARRLLQRPRNTGHASAKGTTVVDHQCLPGKQWWITRVRQGQLFLERTSITHKYIRTQGSLSGHPNFLKVEDKHFHQVETSTTRQQSHTSTTKAGLSPQT